MQPVLQERMMRYETERLSFSLLALCGDGLSHIRERLAANIRSLADLNAKHYKNPTWYPQPEPDLILTPTDDRLSSYQLEETDILTAPQPDPQPSKPHPSEPQSSEPQNDVAEQTAEEATKLWTELCKEQRRLRSEYESELRMSGQDPGTTTPLGRTKDYTAAIHEWVKKLADHGVLRRLHEEVELQNGP
jgi:ubiquitin carboxyl-terminal hydrolase L5